MSGVNIIFGSVTWFGSSELDVGETLDALQRGGVTHIDTAANYGMSEQVLGEADVTQRFTVDTKTSCGWVPNGGRKAAVLADADASAKKLRGTVDVYYLHAPDPSTPIEETLEAMNEVYKGGFFKRLGLSNYRPEDVQKIHDLCKEKGYPLPQVYEGQYNAMARRQEEVLFPMLRRLDMSYHAYSPMAGGFLSKSKEEVLQGKGRFAPGTLLGDQYGKLYKKPQLLDALDEWQDIAKQEKISGADMANRWVRYNSRLSPEHGDALIIGARNMTQLEDVLSTINAGPLSDEAVGRINKMWASIQDFAPFDTFNTEKE